MGITIKHLQHITTNKLYVTNVQYEYVVLHSGVSIVLGQLDPRDCDKKSTPITNTEDCI